MIRDRNHRPVTGRSRLALGLFVLTSVTAQAADPVTVSYQQTPPQQNPVHFVPGTEDLPLMPGLAALAGRGFVFDKAEGRIVAAAASGAVSRRAVLAFYQESLPQLGWQMRGPARFVRDGENLALAFTGADGHLTVDFSLIAH